MQGLQLLRGLLASLSVYLGQIHDVEPATLAGIIFLIFLSGFAASLIHRALGARRCLLLLAVALAMLRLAEQLSPTPEARLGAEIAGVAIWLCLLQSMIAAPLATSGGTRSGRPVIAILLGLIVDTALGGGFATLDPGFSAELGPLIFTVALAAAQLAMIALAAQVAGRRETREPPPDAPARPPTWAFCVGPLLALEVLLFQNLARQVVLIEWEPPATFAWLLTANLLALWLAIILSRQGAARPRWVPLLAAAALVACAAPATSPVLAAIIALAAPVAVAVLLTETLAPEGRGRRSWTPTAVGFLAIPLVLFGWYAHYEIDIGFPQWAIPLCAAAAVFVVVCWKLLRILPQTTRTPERATPSIRKWRREAALTALATLLLLLPLYQFLTWRAPESPPANAAPFRVATYNIHQGFDLYGMPGLERIADALESEHPHVIALQEVPRGWVVNGSVDALSWLAQRLGMHAAWGPAADRFWGNALLSRFPILDVENRPMPNNRELNLDRAFLVATIEVDGEPLQIVATHLHHVESEPEHRLPQVRALLDGVDWSRPTILLGDLNAQPHHTEIRRLEEAGLSAGSRAVPTYPADRPIRQIDYVLTNGAFEIIEVRTVDTDASDHLPLIADLAW
ncbi:MAG: hypothetical protein F4Y04_05440 [Chloroflexi bacterium]|nr:hypothetical protein [Chloroflexota bacterium]